MDDVSLIARIPQSLFSTQRSTVGAMLAVELAVKYKQVKKLVLVSPACTVAVSYRWQKILLIP